MPHDIALEQNVKAALAQDPRVVHEQAIAVLARAGVITLRGTWRTTSLAYDASSAKRASARACAIPTSSPASTRATTRRPSATSSSWSWSTATTPAPS